MVNLLKEQERALEKMTLLLSRRNSGFIVKAKRAAYNRYIGVAKGLGYKAEEVERQWQDIVDTARLTLNAE